MSSITTAFISYSWDSVEHREWVKNLASRLRTDGIDVTLDQWHAIPGDNLPDFMAKSIENNDFVLIICTPAYKEKSQREKGGVKYEGDIITSELFIKQNQRKYIPIHREGSWETASPVWLSGKYYIDLRGEPFSDASYQSLLAALMGKTPTPPPIGRPSSSETRTTDSTVSTSLPNKGWEDIKITGVVLGDVTAPRLDGSRGSALYAVPFRLSRQPPHEWATLFVQNWDHPPMFTNMHRPGIAQVIGDRIILDGTEIEEVEKYHVDTLKLILKKTNQQMAEFVKRENEQIAKQREQEQKHKDDVKDVSDRLKFD